MPHLEGAIQGDVIANAFTNEEAWDEFIVAMQTVVAEEMSALDWKRQPVILQPGDVTYGFHVAGDIFSGRSCVLDPRLAAIFMIHGYEFPSRYGMPPAGVDLGALMQEHSIVLVKIMQDRTEAICQRAKRLLQTELEVQVHFLGKEEGESSYS